MKPTFAMETTTKERASMHLTTPMDRAAVQKVL